MLFRSIALASLVLALPAEAADRTVRIDRETFACKSWAGWREYSQASLSPRGALANAHCPVRIPAKARVTVVDEDAGAGAVEVVWRDKRWFIDAARAE